MRRPARLVPTGPLLVLLAAACGGEPPPAPPPARPVTVLRLEHREPMREIALAGSATPFREERIGFQVGGKVTFVLGVGSEVEGEVADGETVLRRGDVVARLDDTRYRLQVQALDARTTAARKSLEAQRIDLEQVASADVEAAEARLDSATGEVEAARRRIEAAGAAVELARSTLDREQELMRSGAGTPQQLDVAESEYEQAAARREQALAALQARQGARRASEAAVTTARAALELKAAQIQAAEAQVEELLETRKQAERDRADCTLRAPFPGRVTAQHVTGGGIVSPGQPVVTLTLMDPIRISIAVAAEVDARLRPGQGARVHVDGDGGEPVTLYGQVNEKGEVADPATRTFAVSLMIRNQRLWYRAPDPDLPLVRDLLPAVTRYRGEPGPLYVDRDCLYERDGRWSVLRVVGATIWQGHEESDEAVRQVERVAVVPGDDWFPIARWTFRSLVDAGDLAEGQLLVVLPGDLRGEGRDPAAVYGDGVSLGGYRWAVRPGELVPVELAVDTREPGLYAPIRAIRAVNDDRYVFVVRDGTARRVAVAVGEAWRGMRRIEGGTLAAGDRIVVEGVHLVADGEAVTVVGEEDA